MHQEKVQQEKLKAVKARLNFKEVSQHSESRKPSRMKDLRKRLGYKHVQSILGNLEPRRDRSESPRKKGLERKTVFKKLEKGVCHMLGDKENESAPKKNNSKKESSRRTNALSERDDSAGGHWKSRSKRQKSSVNEDDLSQPWVCEETDSFTPQIRAGGHWKSRSKRQKSSVNEDDLSQPWKKCIKDPVKIHNIKPKDGESTEEFVRRDGDLISSLKGGGWDGRFHPKVKSQMIHAATPPVGFSGKIIWLLGQISLLMKISDEEHSTSAWMNFMVVISPSAYNGIIGRPGVRRIQAVPSQLTKCKNFSDMQNGHIAE
nr:reverse transcriptase domain-containing protein [Tanacetum cinerariifolium]